MAAASLIRVCPTLAPPSGGLQGPGHVQKGKGRAPATAQRQRQATKVRCPVVCCASQESGDEHAASRRDVLLGLGAVSVGASLFESLVIPGPAEAANLNQRIQRGKYYLVVRDKFRAFLDDEPAAIGDILNLAFRDAATYDPATKTGGADGSILYSEELNRPANAHLKGIVGKLQKINDELAQELNGPLGKADLIYVAGEVAIKRAFLLDAIRKAGGNKQKGAELAKTFGSEGQWSLFEKRLGRLDADGANADVSLPTKDSSTVEIKAAFNRIGFTPRQTVVLACLLGDPDEMLEKFKADSELEPFVKKYQASRKEISQTSYEVDLITAFTRLSVLGQKEPNTEAYTYTVKSQKIRF